MKKLVISARAVALTALLFSSASAQAQDDNWWRKLFRKDTVEEQETLPSTAPVDSPEVTAPSLPPESFPKSHDTLRTPGSQGLVLRNEPARLATLDSLYRENPPELTGYRVQVFFGSLQQAREVRKTFMETYREVPCYLIQNPPSFAVQIGNFRTQLDAYREARAFKATYPGAIVVPAKIESPQTKTGGKL